MQPITIQYLLIGILTVSFLFSKILNWLNIRRKTVYVPETLQNHVSAEKLQKAFDYKKANYQFGLVTGTFSFLITVAFVVFGFFGWLDDFLRQYTDHLLWLPILYMAVLLIGSDLLSIPFDYYHTFVIEGKFGFNKSTVSTFFIDKIKGYLISIPVGGALLLALLSLIQYIGPDFWWQFWIVAAAFMILINNFYASLILPLFNKLSPLEDGELKEKILTYAQSVDFSLNNVFVIDGSKRSSKANAFFSGFGNQKKVVLYDTLIEQHQDEELVAVLAHEIGHYKKKHIIQGMSLGVLQTGLILYILSLLIYSESLSMALGGGQLAIHLNLIGFSMLFTPVSSLIGIAMNLLSRKNEFEADAFARDTFAGQPLASALKTLSVNSLSELNPHPWYVFVNYSHPPLLQRLDRLERV
jgi:STE24 endopeptidase